MRRSCRLSKGQWFIISAVVMSGVFLVISSMLKVSFGVDASEVGRRNEGFYFNNIREQISNIESKCLAGGDMSRDMKEFAEFSRRSMESRGYLFFMNYTINGCSAESVGLMVASEKGFFYQNLDPNEIVPGII